MTDDAHSSPQDYVTLTEAAAHYGFNYNALYKYVFVGRLAATWLEPDQIPVSIWQRMDVYAQANVTKKGGVWVTTHAQMQTYLESRKKGRRTDLEV
ncbi:hypothetical protein Haur_5014 (plasmid) [Herpetosiphon aurantiacus DSM 785]|uniref:Helix-turn-helix domain-containing protein n=1 Tax=Herpetosiphon aurantiacus (strain ATCC 23779 / DSM 785 / 114-95) TaxID=316274 RepID=A9B8I0_HERA2|nr:hypothetical protein Haur_5014 [Herpetosiphon aurantiacus DSM 785]